MVAQWTSPRVSLARDFVARERAGAPKKIRPLEDGRKLQAQIKGMDPALGGTVEIEGAVPITEPLILSPGANLVGKGGGHSPYGARIIMAGGEKDVLIGRGGHFNVSNLCLTRDTKRASETTGNGILLDHTCSNVNLIDVAIERQRVGIMRKAHADGQRSIMLHITRCIVNEVGSAHFVNEGGLETFIDQSYFLSSRGDGLVCTNGASGIYFDMALVYGCKGCGLLLDNVSVGWITDSCGDMCEGHNAELNAAEDISLRGHWFGGAGYTLPIEDEWDKGFMATAPAKDSESCGLVARDCDRLAVELGKVYIPAYRGARIVGGWDIALLGNAFVSCGTRTPGKRAGIGIEIEGAGGAVDIQMNRIYDSARFGLGNTGLAVKATGKRASLFLIGNRGPVMDTAGCRTGKGKLKQAASLVG